MSICSRILHAGAANTSSTPKVQYAYSEMTSGANHSRLTGIIYPNGRTVSYDYGSGLNDSISRLDALKESTTVLEGYSYLGLGTVVARPHANGVDLTYVKRSGESNGDAGDQYNGLDRFGRVVDQRWVVASTGTATDRFQYTYDRDSNRLTRSNLVNSSFDETYTYDGLNQLASFARGSHTQAWDYDAIGNFDSVTTDGGSPVTRSANAQNEITSISGLTTPTYDANGNMTTDQNGLKFYYDAWNRLVTVKNSAGTTTLTSYQYDGTNRRVSENPGTARDLYYSAGWQVLEERVGGAAQVQYVWSPVYIDAQVMRDRDTDANGSLDERFWVQQDANWNVTTLVDGSGVAQERYAFDAYGAVTIYSATYTVRTTSSYSETYLFQGRPLDSITGDYDNRMRWYSPTLGRAVSLDPLGFTAWEVNFYRWVANNPTNWADPTGLDKWYYDPNDPRANSNVPNKVYAGTIDYNLVTQGLPSDCWLISAIVGLAYHRPEELRQMIRSTGTPGEYRVTLPGRAPVVVRDDGVGSRPEWVRLLELAASHFSDINTVRGLGFGEGITLLTGHGTCMSTNVTGIGFATWIWSKPDQGKIVIGGTGTSLLNTVKVPYISQEHNYAILRGDGMRYPNGPFSYQVRNPALGDTTLIRRPNYEAGPGAFWVRWEVIRDNYLAVVCEK